MTAAVRGGRFFSRVTCVYWRSSGGIKSVLCVYLWAVALFMSRGLFAEVASF